MARKLMIWMTMLALAMIRDSLARMLGKKRFTESGSPNAKKKSDRERQKKCASIDDATPNRVPGSKPSSAAAHGDM